MRQRLVERVRAEYREMPGLSLTLAQARRLFGLPQDACARILDALTREGLLRQETDGRFARRDARP
jgi:DNA-binding IclR family transcriptional regulator